MLAPLDHISACHSIRLTPVTVGTSDTANSRQLKTVGTLQEPTPFKRPKRNGFISGSTSTPKYEGIHIATLKRQSKAQQVFKIAEGGVRGVPPYSYRDLQTAENSEKVRRS